MKKIAALSAALAALLSCVKEAPVVPVASISISPAEIVIKEGEQRSLSATVSPADATDKTLVWSSSAPEVATVTDGRVTGISKGQATITVAAGDGSGARAACAVKVKYANPEISFDPGQQKDIVAGSEGGTYTLSFTALEKWTASVINTRADSWLEISPTSGEKGRAEIKVSVAKNTGYDDRSASVRITCDEETETVTVTQKQKDAITLTTDRFELGSNGGDIVVKLKSNVQFSCRIGEDCASWIQAATTKSYDEYTLNFIVRENTDITKREGSIVFTDGTLSETVKVFQEGARPSIVISKNTYEIGSDGGEIRVDVGSNVDVVMVIPEEASWLREVSTKAFSTNTFYLMVDSNPYPDGRSATVLFVNNENGLSEKVYIEQRQQDQINIKGNEVTVGEAGGAFDLTLESNITYSVSVDADWLREVTTKGLVSYSHSFSVDPLPDDVFTRSATIKFTGAQGQPSQSFSVIQKDRTPAIQFKDAAVKAICVEMWDRNGDGELSEREAANVKDLGQAFRGNTDITSFEELSYFTGLNEISENAFYGCNSLVRIKLPAGITAIGDRAFFNCQVLEGIMFPDALTTIGSWAFGYCNSLKQIVLPASITSIGPYALACCRSLLRVECLAADPPVCGEQFLMESPDGWIVVPDGSVRKYKEADDWKPYEERIISVKEEQSPAIQFKDAAVKAVCVENWDRNGDGELSEREAAAVKELSYAFNNNKDITSFEELVYFTGLTALSGSAFYSCELLASISLPKTLTSIGSWAFGYCKSLSSIVIPASVTTIGDYAFYYCQSLRRMECLSAEPPACGENYLQRSPDGWIVVPEGCAQKYKEADGWRDYPERIISVKEEQSPAIQFKDAAVKAICVENWDRNGDGEFSEREAAAVKDVSRVFYQNADITSFEELAYFTGLTEIPNYAFRECKALVAVRIPEGVTTIRIAAFYGCESLSILSLPKTLTVLEEWSFGYCASLGGIVIPANVTTIGEYALYNDKSLRMVECLSTNPPVIEDGFLEACPEGWIIVPDGCVQKYREADGWKKFPERIITAKEMDSPAISFKDAATKAFCVMQWDRNGDGEFSEREAASVVDLGRYEAYRTITSFDELEYFIGLTSIPSNIFYSNTNLTSVKFPPNLTEIQDYAFGYTGLQGELELPAGLKVIGRGAFTGCTGLSGDLTIPAGVTEIPADVFYSCSGIKGRLSLPAGIKSIGRSSFYKTDFSRVDIPATEIPEVGERAFDPQGCFIYVPQGRAVAYQEADGWKDFAVRITEEGHLPKEFFYSSTDYSRDGEVVCLQQATKGKGINIIFLGDGFVDRDMAPGGKYEALMRRWMEQFFAYEPYTTFREWFNIYTVKVVSRNYLFGSPDAERRLTRNLGADEGTADFGNSIETETAVCREYAQMVPNPDNQSIRVAVFMNSEKSVGRSFCSYGSGGYCMGFIFDHIDARPSTLNHEIGGHGFAWLADEYEEFTEACPDPQSLMERYWKSGYYMNLDWRSNPDEVRWARFLQDSRYANEGLGVFEGGARYPKGLFRPTKNSMMRHDYSAGAVFNAPSREQIYKNIMLFGSTEEEWEYDYETFVAADAAGRKQAAEAYAANPTAGASPRSRTGTAGEDLQPGLPPILVDETVRKIIVSADGTVRLVR